MKFRHRRLCSTRRAPTIARILTLLLNLGLLSSCASRTSDTAPEPFDWRQHDPHTVVIVAVDNPTPPTPLSPGSSRRGYESAPRYAASAQARQQLAELGEAFALQQLAAWPIPSLRLHCAAFALPHTADSPALLQRLQQDARVRLATPMQQYRTLATAAGIASVINYNDPYLALQRGFRSVNAAAAHQWSRGQGVRIAIIDTGVDAEHPDLHGQLLPQQRFVSAQDSTALLLSHGTEVAGIIAARGNNGQGIVGVAPAAKLLPLQACWHTSADNAQAVCNSFTLAQALSAALDAGVDIINLSLAGPADPLLGQLLEQALARDIIVVAALPPDGRANGFPSAINGVISVATELPTSTDALQAPGRDILTLTPGGHYDFVSGSSMAAAHVSGTIALLLASQRDLDGARALALLRSSRDPHSGSVDACAALAAQRAARACPPVPASTVTPAALPKLTRNSKARAH